MSEKDKTELLAKLRIEAPALHKAEYEKLLINYQDVLSRDKFDL